MEASMKRPVLLALAAVATGGFALQTQTGSVAQVETIFRESCSIAACHEGGSPPMNLNLERDMYRENLVGVPSEEKPAMLRVDPGNPDRSYLVMKVEGGEDIVGVRMPFGRNPLTADQIKAIRAWVASLK